MIGPNVELSLPPAHWFTFPPSDSPRAIPPPLPADDEFTWKSPIAVDPTFYNNALHPALPITFAFGYLLFVAVSNIINGRRNYKPWAISKTEIFRAVVVLHNLVLAIYSGLTCFAMIRAVSVSFPGFLGQHGLPGAVDSLCKINGPRGYGDAITFNSSTSAWASKNTKILLLGQDQPTPDSTDVGRIWNEGLAFWGWLFYLSKYYEVLDNVIVLAKGKRCSTLQVYHHAGALLCVWAGIRYMSPPIWMFVVVNSGIHAMMYSYYTATTLGYKVNRRIKKTITTLQIGQFVWGMVFASAHLFISYSAPVSIAYTVTSVFSGIPSAASSAAMSVKSFASEMLSSKSISSMTSKVTDGAMSAKSFAHDITSSGSISSLAARATDEASTGLSSLATKFTDHAASLASEATDSAASLASKATDSASSLATQATSTASALASKVMAEDGLWLKKLLYRAAGREALAEAVRNSAGQLFGPEFDEHLIERTVEQVTEEIRYYTEHQTARCIDTDGQAFAIWLNVLYLAPLMGFFLHFFRRTYSRRGSDGKPRTASESAKIAARITSDVVEKIGKQVEDDMEALGEEVEDGGAKLKAEESFEKVKEVAREKAREYKVDERVEAVKEKVREVANRMTGNKDAGEAMEEQESGAPETDDDRDDLEESTDLEASREIKRDQPHGDKSQAGQATPRPKKKLIKPEDRPAESKESKLPAKADETKEFKQQAKAVEATVPKPAGNSASSSTSSIPTASGSPVKKENRNGNGGGSATGAGSTGGGGNSPKSQTPKPKKKV